MGNQVPEAYEATLRDTLPPAPFGYVPLSSHLYITRFIIEHHYDNEVALQTINWHRDFPAIRNVNIWVSGEEDG